MSANLSNLTGMAKSNGLVGITQYVNDASGSVFGIMLILSIFFILYFTFSSRGYDGKRGLLSASFITMLSAIFLRMISIVSDKVVFVLIILFAVMIMWSWLSES